MLAACRPAVPSNRHLDEIRLHDIRLHLDGPWICTAWLCPGFLVCVLAAAGVSRDGASLISWVCRALIVHFD
jgi:hypothetical protein